ncbi:MAG: electron transport complex subunit RsxG [Saccharospirillaceae bacterium]|nr:electron transport complex subunit RsxG [Pseudomonadales bacterium]NRB79982.1 electron transport complex subunit RsxG [Saccharospirillaceae bacterium]
MSDDLDNKIDTQNTDETTEKQDLTVKQSIFRNAVGLALFAFFTAGLIGITQIATKQRIEQNVKAFQQQSLLALMQEGLIDNDLLEDQHDFTQGKFINLELLNIDPKSKAKYFLGFKNGQIKSIILPVTAPDGYTGNIDMLCAISPNGDVLGVRVIEHKETPGLGDKIDIKKDDWITDFNGKNLDNIRWNVTNDGGDFDAFTGATITPRAVVKSIKRALDFYELNKSVFLSHTQIIKPTAVLTSQLIQE